VPACFEQGADLKELLELPVREQIARARYLEESRMHDLDQIADTIREQIAKIAAAGDEENEQLYA
jgi:V/A-type H+/Na+-transporting ATPase subunit A